MACGIARRWKRAIGHAALRAPVMVRLADHSAVAISEALDAGAEGVLAPLVETADAGAQRSSRRRAFRRRAPRSGGGVRPGRNFAAYVERARRDTVVGVMIETRRRARQRGSDCGCRGRRFRVHRNGRSRACRSASFPPSGKAHAEACAAILAACQRVNKPCGAYAFSPESRAAIRRAGISIGDCRSRSRTCARRACRRGAQPAKL